MKYFLNLKSHAFLLIIIIIEVILLAVNYVPGTYLLGWDNIMPEFNPLLNLKRSFFGVWQDYRGLGLLDGLSHTANLLHIVYVSILSIALPQSLVRYIFIFLTHLIGGIGFYYLARYLTKNNKASFLGALFYMFNIGTVQMFFAPLEVFAIHFAALPFLALFISKTLSSPTKKNFLILILTAIFSTPQAFVPTIFIAFSILFIFFLIFHYFSFKNLKLLLLITFIFFSVNAFWLLPYLYSTKENSSIIINTRINQFSSEEIFGRNKAFGGITQVLGLTGYMMGTIEYDTKSHKNVFFMDAWRKHQNTFFYKLIYLLTAGISLGGLVEIIRRKKQKYFPYAASFAVALFFLANNTFILEEINSLLRNVFPILSEVLRFPFTKFITLFVFCFALFFSFGLSLIFNYLNQYKKYLVLTVALTLFILAFPAFQGQFISPLLKVKLPKDYLQLMKHLDQVDENQRIALLPAYTFWNWQYRSWGQRGSGFLWYGIKQPLLKRPFDPWSLQNEQFYNEISYAVKSENSELFKNVVDKYDIAYLLVDSYLINNLSEKPMNYDRLQRFLSLSSDIYEEKKKFGNLTLYKIKDNNPWIFSLDKNNTPNVNAAFSFSGNDQVFASIGNYITSSEESNVIYPFHLISTDRSPQTNEDFKITQTDKNISFTVNNFIDLEQKNYTLEIPSIFNSEYLIPVKFTIKDDQIQLKIITPQLFVNDNPIDINEDAILITPRIVSRPKTITFVDINHTIKEEEESYIKNNFVNTLKLTDDNNEEFITIDTKNIRKDNFQINLNASTLNSIKVNIEKIKSPLMAENIISEKDYEVIFPTKDSKKNGIYKLNNKKEISFEIKDGSVELAAWKSSLSHQASYFIFFQTEHISGLPLTFYVDNPFEKRAEFETRLSKSSLENFAILPKTQDFFEGYGLHLINKSIGSEITKNIIKEISIYPIPLEMIKGTRITPANFVGRKKIEEKSPADFQKVNSFLYKVSPQYQKNSVIVLSQAYNSGWKAFQIPKSNLELKNYLNTYFPFIFGQELKDHVLVNNWANGWKLDLRSEILDRRNKTSNIKDQRSVILVFWPQYLEFLGFIVLITLITFMLFKGRFIRKQG